MKPISEMSAGELAAFVAGHLKQSGIEVVLSGGACVTIWSEGLYVSADLDLIGDGTTPRSSLRKALAEIGFVEQGRQFVHPDARFFVDCPPGPVALGREAPKEIRTMRFATGSLRLLSPTDCVKDRLLAWYHWHDRQSLEQAALVAERNPVDLNVLAAWSKREGKLEAFEEVKERLSPSR
jgi:hypothetical protein